MSMNNIKEAVRKGFNTVKDELESKREAHTDRTHVHWYINKNSSLTKDEKERVKKLWGGVSPCPVSRGFKYYEGLKKLRGFDERYLPLSLYIPYFERILNPDVFKKTLANKSLLELVYRDTCKVPKTILKSVGGILMDSENNVVDTNKAIELLEKSNGGLLKPSTETQQGFGIKLVTNEDIDSLIEKLRKNIPLIPSNDFILQEKVIQSDLTSVFNPTSLNCFRVSTLNMNGEVSVCSRALKCGPKDSVVDNIGSGKRGVIVGVNEDGSLEEKGFYGNGEMSESHNNVTFKNKRIESFSKVISAALRLHSLTDSCKFIGWDIALDEDEEPILIEGNTIFPGVSFEQMCSGPIFGDRTEEVIEFLRDELKKAR